MARRIASEEIYDALLDDSCFAALPARLAQAFGARSAQLHWVADSGGAEVLGHSGYFRDADLADYAARFAAIDPWIAATAGDASLLNRATDLEAFVSAPEFMRSDFYNAFLRPLGDDTCRGIGVRVRTSRGSGYVALHRGLGQARFDTETLAALDASVADLSRLLALRGRMAALETRCASLEAMGDALGQPVLLVAPSGRLRHANAAARDLLDRGDGLRLHEGRLTAGAAGATRMLETALERALAASPRGAEAIALPRPCGAMLTLSIVAVPDGAGGRSAMLIASEPEASEAERSARLRLLYRLSPSEAALAVMLADGDCPETIARRRGVTIGTVRLQIKAVAAKLDCRRQAEIVRIVRSLPPLTAPR